MRRFHLTVTALGLGLLAACPNRPISKVTPVANGADLKDIPVSADVDILFVVDNSSSTQDKQSVFSSNFSNFVTALDAFPTGRPNLHIGVVNTTVDLGGDAFNNSGCPHPDGADNGKLQTAGPSGDCGVGGSFITDLADPSQPSGRSTNYGSDLATALGCIAQVGDSGCGFEAPLNAMKRALDGSVTANAGFIRSGAYLAVVFLTDEDDASVKDGTAGYDVFTLPANTVGGANDFRVQPLFAYDCDQPLTAGSGSAAYTNCKARTDSYLEDPVSYSQFLTTMVKDSARTVVAVIAGPPPQDINGAQFMTNDMTPQTAGNANGTSIAVFGGDGKTIETGSLSLNTETQDPALLPSCAFMEMNGDTALGRPAVRLADFEQQFDNHGRFYTICQDDYSNALTDIGTTLFNAISPCLIGTVDTTDISTSNPGPQLDCEVTAVLNLGGSDETSTRLPVCQMSDVNVPMTPTSGQCYWIKQDDTNCTGSADDGYSIQFEPPMGAPTGTTMQVECATLSQ